jgi:hypothetical protein
MKGTLNKPDVLIQIGGEKPPLKFRLESNNEAIKYSNPLAILNKGKLEK